MRLIYAIQHNSTKRIYVGCTSNCSRVPNHLKLLKAGTHPVPLMQEDCNKYGHNYSVYMLQVVEDGIASEEERKWMHYFNTGNPEYGYNYLDKKASKRSIDSFPKYTEEEWKRKRQSWKGFSRRVFLEEVQKLLAHSGMSFDALAESVGISKGRAELLMEDSRRLSQTESMRIAEALGIET